MTRCPALVVTEQGTPGLSLVSQALGGQVTYDLVEVFEFVLALPDALSADDAGAHARHVRLDNMPQDALGVQLNVLWFEVPSFRRGEGAARFDVRADQYSRP
ncbi:MULTISPECIES: hypothetical protein [unclassified Deinococcus]|uniref:hypothetical protein n=1 Tax=unclassified Deinococcus TaxID=2623546 RepID=UPI001C30691C|nr:MULTISPECIES: hypothetical protein [unclassified Deinococcus]MDK2013976.1 hypothetical protein [Deinococcus sp. 43]